MSLFGSTRVNDAETGKYYFRIQTSLEGKALPLAWGTVRMAGNLIWADDFTIYGGAGSGKGGGGNAAGGKGASKSSSATFSVAVIIALTQTLVNSYGLIWDSTALTTFASLNLTQYFGTTTQNAWPYLTSKHPDQALNYRGISYLAAGPMQLGSSQTLPNITVEVCFAISNPYVGIPDANPADVFIDFLTNADYGLGFQSSYVDSFTSYRQYTQSLGLFISPLMDERTEARSFMQDILEATNSEAVFSNGKLRIVPYGEANSSGYGQTYTAPAAPIYLLDDDDFRAPQGTNPNSTATFNSQQDPVTCTRLRQFDAMNSVPMEYLNRVNAYNPAVIQADNEAEQILYGLRRDDTRTYHFFCTPEAASQSAQLILANYMRRNTYTFTVGQEFILLDPMDVIAITDPGLGTDLWIWIQEITENQDYTLTITGIEFLNPTAAPPLVNRQTGTPFSPETNTPTTLNNVAFMEPGAAFAEVNTLLIGLTGYPNFGGADIWFSADNVTYIFVGTFKGNTTAGYLLSSLPIVYVPNGAPYVLDTTDTLSVELLTTQKQLLSVSTQAAYLKQSLCWINGEMLSFANASLVSGEQYNITYLVRGLYGSTPAAQGTDSTFVYLGDGQYYTFDFAPDQIGLTLYWKFLPFNSFGGGKPALDEISPYVYTLQGLAYSTPPPDVVNFTLMFISNHAYLSWGQPTDFRVLNYEIRKGYSWAEGIVVGVVLHPPFQIFGDDTYWLGVYVQPQSGVKVYSQNPQSITVTGSIIAPFVFELWDEGMTGWPGTLTGAATVSGSTITVTPTGGALSASGTYSSPSYHNIDMQRVCQCIVDIAWQANGIPIGQNILTMSNILTQPDLLGFLLTQNVVVYPLISISQDNVTWGPYQRWVPGSYLGRVFRVQMFIESLDAQTTTVLTQFVWAVLPPERDDHYVNYALSAGFNTIYWTPDGSGTPVSFSGGPYGASQPGIQGAILGVGAGEVLEITSVTLGSGVFRILNSSGVAVSGYVNLLVQGF